MIFYTSSEYAMDLAAAAMHTVRQEELYGSSVLITGASGTIGSFIVDLLLYLNRNFHAGITIFAAGRSSKRLMARFGEEADGLKYVCYDLSEPVSFDFHADYIIHAAGNAYPAAFDADPVGTLMASVAGTDALLRYGIGQKAKRFLYVSSGEVYGQGMPDVKAFTESFSGYVDLLRPRSAYPMGKRAAETLCAAFCAKYGMDTVIVRPSHTYGPSAVPSDNRAHASFLRDGLAGRDIIMNSDGAQIRSYTYIGDAASAILSVLTAGETGNAYNIANRFSTSSIYEFASEVARQCHCHVKRRAETEHERKNKTLVVRQVLDDSKIRSLGWEGMYDIPGGIGRAIAIMRQVNGRA